MATIYRASKTSGEVGGRPSLVPIVGLPTDQTGIQVKIEIKSPDDVRKFTEVIQRVVAAGEMNVELNGVKVPTLPFSEAKDGYLITRKPVGAEGSNHRIFVRYGHVIYPVDQENVYSAAYREATDLLGKLPGGTYGADRWRLILQAQPHTISVTPSRESLSMKDHTIETLRGLLQNFVEAQNKQLLVNAQVINKACVDQTFLNMHPSDVLETHKAIVGLSVKSVGDVLTDFSRISRAVIAAHYPKSDEFRKSDIELRLRSLILSGYGNRGKIQSYLAAYLDKRQGKDSDRETWFTRRIVAPLVLSIGQNKELSTNRLMVYGTNEHSSESQRRMSYSQHTFSAVTKFKKYNFEHYLPFLRNLIILTYNRGDVEERADNFPEMKHWFGSSGDCLTYLVQRSDTEVAAAREFFAKRGYYVLDLTKRRKGEAETAVAPRAPAREYKTRAKGIPLLKSILPEGAKRISTDLAKADDVARTENPEFLVKSGARNDTHFFEDLDAVTSKAVVHLFGSRGGIVVNDTQAAKYKALGAKPLHSWLWEKVFTELKTNRRIRQYWSDNHRRELGMTGPYRLDYQGLAIVDAIAADVHLSTYYSLSTLELTADDRAYLTLWDWYYNKHKHAYRKPVEHVELTKFLTDIPISIPLAKLIMSVNKGSLTSVISASSLKDLLAEAGTTPEINAKKTRARDILIYVLKD